MPILAIRPAVTDTLKLFDIPITDPTIAPGVFAPVGSCIYYDNTGFYFKFGQGSTDWAFTVEAGGIGANIANAVAITSLRI